MKKRMNYKKLYGITLAQAKELSKAKIGRYPRPGCEIPIKKVSMNLAAGITFSLSTMPIHFSSGAGLPSNN